MKMKDLADLVEKYPDYEIHISVEIERQDLHYFSSCPARSHRVDHSQKTVWFYDYGFCGL